MADEFKIIQTIQCVNGNFRFPDFDGRRRKFDQTTQGGGVPGTINVPHSGTAAEGTLIDLSALTTANWTLFQNVDPTNYIELGVQDGGGTFIPFSRLQPGTDPANSEEGMRTIIPINGAAIYARANTADAQLYVAAFET